MVKFDSDIAGAITMKARDGQILVTPEAVVPLLRVFHRASECVAQARQRPEKVHFHNHDTFRESLVRIGSPAWPRPSRRPPPDRGVARRRRARRSALPAGPSQMRSRTLALSHLFRPFGTTPALRSPANHPDGDGA